MLPSAAFFSLTLDPWLDFLLVTPRFSIEDAAIRLVSKPHTYEMLSDSLCSESFYGFDGCR